MVGDRVRWVSGQMHMDLMLDDEHVHVLHLDDDDDEHRKVQPSLKINLVAQTMAVALWTQETFY